MTYRLEILTHIPEDELEEYKKFVDMLVKTPISKLSKDDLDKMMKYYMSKKEMIEIAMKKTGDNEGEYEYDMNLLYAIINSIYADVRNNDYNGRLLKFSDGETMIEYYRNVKHFTEYKKYIDYQTKPESKVESSPYVDNEKPNPNIGNANSNLRESSVIIGVIILLIILLIAGVVLAIINSEYLPLFIVTIPSCIGAWCLYTIYKEN